MMYSGQTDNALGWNRRSVSMQQMMRFVSGADMVEFQKQESRTYLKIKHLRLLLVIPLRFERKTHALEGLILFVD